MRVFVLCALFALPVSAAEFTLELEEGEIPRGSITSTYVVRDDTVSVTTKASGRATAGLKAKPRTAKLSNLKELEAALVALRATADDTPGPTKFFTYKNACLREGKTSLCTESRFHNASRLEAFEKLEQLLMAELKK